MGNGDWFVGFENLSEGAEVEFLGIAVGVAYPCDCPKCRAGAEKIGRTNDSQLHIVIAPITNYRRLQHVFIDMSRKFKYSRRGVWEHAIVRCKIDASSKKKFAKFLMSNVIEYRKTTIEDYVVNVMGVSKDEINRLKRSLGITLDAQVLYPEKVIPKDAYELYGISEELVKERYKVFREAWSRIKKGEPDSEVYEWVDSVLNESETNAGNDAGTDVDTDVDTDAENEVNESNDDEIDEFVL